jgi:hypothetical protein
MKKKRTKDLFLETLKKVPIVQVSCEKVGLSRNSVYRWRKEDKDFAKEMDKAMLEGEDFINDISEGQLLNMIKEKSWPALAFWLKHRNPKFKDKIEISGEVEHKGKLTPEQEALVRKALGLASFNNSNKDNGATK